MRVLKVSGENLASLAGPFVIDFEADPLQSAGLFAITGHTGSGKSTLLDAICLALYDRVPRLAAADHRARVGREGPDAAQVRYADVRGILRHGTGSGYAEVEFVGQDQRRYLSRWEVRRARGRASGNLQAQTITLTDVETGQTIGDKKMDTLVEIQKRVGLDFEQFRRAVLLAQGEFDSFIRADVRQRAELLERITGTQIYAKLSMAAHQRAKAEREKQERLRIQLDAQPVLSDADRTAAEKRLADTHRTLQLRTAEYEALRKAVEWFDRCEHLTKVVNEGERALVEAQRADDAATGDRQTLDLAQKAFGLRAEIEAAESARHRTEQLSVDLDSALKRHASLENTHTEALAAEKEAQETSRKARAAYDEIGPLLDEAKELDTLIGQARSDRESKIRECEKAVSDHHAAMARHSAAQEQLDAAVNESNATAVWLENNGATRILAERLEMVQGDLQSMTKVTQEIDEQSTLVTSQDRDAENAIQQRSIAETDREALLRSIERLETELSPLRDEIATVNRPALDKTREALQELRTAGKNARFAARELVRLQGSLQENGQESADCRSKGTTAEQTLDAIAVELPVARARVDEARHGLLRSEASVSEQAEHLRSFLEPEQPCPVCGATEHPFATESRILDERLEEDRARVAELQQSFDELNARAARVSAERDASRAELERLQKARVNIETRILEWTGSWDNAVAAIERSAPVAGMEIPALPALPVTPDTDAAFDHFEKMISSRLEAVTADIASFDEHIARLNALESARQQEEQRSQELRVQIDEWTKREALCRGKADAARLLIQEKTASRDAIGQRLDTALGGAVPDWRNRLRKDPSALDRLCIDSARQWSERSARLEVQQRQVASLQAEVAGLAASLTATSAQVELVEEDVRGATARYDELQARRKTVIDGRPVNDVRTEHKNRVEMAENDERRAVTRRTTVATELTEARTREEALQQAHREAVNVLSQAEGKLTDRLARAGLSHEAATVALTKGEAWWNAESKRLEGLRQAVVASSAALEEQRRTLAQHRGSGQPDADRETTMQNFTVAREAQQLATDEYAEAQAVIKADDHARASVADLHKELAAHSAAAAIWYQLDEIIGSADGAKFRGFVQRLTLDHLLRRSNGHLKDLAPRFHLECVPGGDLALQVVDRDMGDEVRGVHNLSGGERFLVSLALALGLASMSTSQGLKVETLFIDEGFGALDDRSLAMAVSALESLQSTGRKVGVISHVSELKERIGVQIQVSPCGGGRSEIEVLRA